MARLRETFWRFPARSLKVEARLTVITIMPAMVPTPNIKR